MEEICSERLSVHNHLTLFHCPSVWIVRKVWFPRWVTAQRRNMWVDPWKQFQQEKNWWQKKKKAFKICWLRHSQAFASKLVTRKGHCEETRGNTVFMGTNLWCQCHVLCFLCRGFYLKRVQQAEWVSPWPLSVPFRPVRQLIFRAKFSFLVFAQFIKWYATFVWALFFICEITSIGSML